MSREYYIDMKANKFIQHLTCYLFFPLDFSVPDYFMHVMSFHNIMCFVISYYKTT